MRPATTRVLLGIIVLALVWLPYALTLFWQMEFLTTGNESLAYRYFLSERSWLGEPGFIWQGHLTTVIQNAIYAALQLPLLHTTDFRNELQAFGASTLVITLLAISFFFIAALCDKHLRLSDKLLVGFAATFPVYGIRAGGLYYLFLPDYYAISLALTVATAWITLRLLRSSEGADSDRFLSIIVGVLGALWIGNKVTTAALMLPAVILVLARSRRNLTLIAAAGAATLAAVLCLYYIGHFHDIWHFPSLWLAAVAKSQGEGQGNLLQWLKQTLYSPYGWVFAFTIASGIIGTASTRRGAPLTRAVMWTCWLVFAWFCFVIFKRPSGSTMFEATLAWTVLACIWLAEAHRYVAMAVSAGVLALSVAATTCSDLGLFTTSHDYAEKQWGVFNRAVQAAHGRPILVVLPSNDYGSGSVFELILKGTADFPTWNISERGERLIDRHVPGMRFVHEYGGPMFKQPIAKGTVVVWFDRQDLTPLGERVPELKQLLHSPSYACSAEPLVPNFTAHLCAPRSE